ncbi:hydroxyacid dehydrogenase [Candidatus Desantisbacteria bacterium CG07_land_8_20_14_0_80_39_15]|uniref:Hydroxyacid dehydrogenase n=1 Tax=Candidatus Desantisbacteria bacterium CG07_land_8_20_14_0_80_39_15 TaxID=1974549 RepID=A0A2M6ZI06_9BACT|nr:MAG: hydroxyacid dehydrogenase [Candidatus Desantisbacteria bacterium CG07_land_8_20_14_0_80_39_15]
MKIAIVNSSSFGVHFPIHIKKLSTFGSVERIDVSTDITGGEFARRLEGIEVIIATVTPIYDREFFNKNKSLVMISRHGVGVDNIDIASATESGVIVTRVPGRMERDSVAEHAIALLFTVARKVVPSVESAKKGRWSERARFLGREINGKKVGILGIGEIGSRIAEILTEGFRTKVFAYDPNLKPEEIKLRGAEPVELEYLLKECDIIFLQSPLTKENYHMLGEKEFSLMKNDVVIVNTARGELIDEKTLIKYLKKGKIGGIGMDVVEGEPIDERHPLLKFENVIITPHTAAYTKESLKRMGDKLVEDVRRISKKEIPEFVVNQDVLKKENRAGINL